MQCPVRGVLAIILWTRLRPPMSQMCPAGCDESAQWRNTAENRKPAYGDVCGGLQKDCRFFVVHAPVGRKSRGIGWNVWSIMSANFWWRTAAKSRCASCAPPARWASVRSPCTPNRIATNNMWIWRTKPTCCPATPTATRISTRTCWSAFCTGAVPTRCTPVMGSFPRCRHSRPRSARRVPSGWAPTPRPWSIWATRSPPAGSPPARRSRPSPVFPSRSRICVSCLISRRRTAIRS